MLIDLHNYNELIFFYFKQPYGTSLPDEIKPLINEGKPFFIDFFPPVLSLCHCVRGEVSWSWYICLLVLSVLELLRTKLWLTVLKLIWVQTLAVLLWRDDLFVPRIYFHSKFCALLYASNFYCVLGCAASEHNLVEYSFDTIQRCHLCQNFLLGLVRQGLQCRGKNFISIIRVIICKSFEKREIYEHIPRIQPPFATYVFRLTSTRKSTLLE